MSLLPNIWSGLEGGNQVERPSGTDAPEIWAYTDKQSYGSGEAIMLFVHTTAPLFDIEIMNETGEARTVAIFKDLPGRAQATNHDPAINGCGWTDPVLLEPTEAWGTGAFVVLLHAHAEKASIPGEAFFVLRATERRECRIAMVLTTATWQAYNDWGQGNHYRSVEGGISTDNPLPVVSRQRPWARGLIRQPADAPRHSDVPDLPLGGTPDYGWLRWALDNGYSRHYCDAGWAHYEKPFAEWLHRNGYAFDVLTQDDLHFRPSCLAPYDVVLLVGHDEYWTWEMRDTIDAFLDRGGRMARFAGNMVWQIRLEDNGTRQACYRLSAIDPEAARNPSRSTTYWDSQSVGRPAASTFGLTGVWGGYHHFGTCSPRSSAGYTVYRPDHWCLSGTQLRYGDLLGAGGSRILAFEVDGVDYTFRYGLPYPTGVDGSPPSLEIVALAPACSGEIEGPHSMVNAPLSEVLGLLEAEPSAYPRPPESRQHGAAIMASFRRGKGEGFNAGTCEWVSGLIRKDEAACQITRNVLDRFLGQV